MYFRDLTPDDANAVMPQSAVLRLPYRVGSRDPETAIVRPVARRLEKRGAAKMRNWRVWTRGEGEVMGVELSLDLTQPTRMGLVEVAKALRSAPLGSSVRFSAGGEPLVFGGSEAVEVSLPRLDPGKSKIAARCSEALGRSGQVRGWSIGAHATKLYIYGPEAKAIVNGVKPVLGEVPTRPVP